MGSSAEVGPEPRQISYVDLDQPDPELPADPRYTHVWVVGCRAGRPVVAGEIDVREGAAAVAARLAELRATARAAVVDAVPDDAVPVDDAMLPPITVVVPTIVARVDDLQRCLQQLAELDYPRFEVILADNRPTTPADDRLPGLLEPYPNFRSVRAPRRGISQARNAGATAAAFDVIAFTDDDVRVDPLWLRGIGARMARDPSTDVVTGLILPAELETPAQVWFERYHGGFGGERTFRPALLARSGRHVEARDDSGAVLRRLPVYGVGAYGAGANMAFRRSALQRIGGFDVALGTGTPTRGGEDLAALIAVLWTGGGLTYEPRAIVRHKHRGSMAELHDQLRANGIGFTAMLTALVVADRSHLWALLGQLPAALRAKLAQVASRLRRGDAGKAGPEEEEPALPRRFVLLEVSGYARGPAAYVRSRISRR